MQAIKRAIWGPDPKEQMRTCQSLLRKNQRQLDRHIQDLMAVENKTKTLIKQAAKRNDVNSAKVLAKEMYHTRRQRMRMTRSKAQLQSIGMQMNEAFGLRKIQGTMKTSTDIMKDVNLLIKIPELTGTMQMLSSELMKAGIIDEMVTDSLEEIEEDDDVEEDAEAEISKILEEVTAGKLKSASEAPKIEMPQVSQIEPQEETAVLDDMRERLKALQS
ncbi:hypothetical protein CANCADRAFT_115722 [Tortispora caseinolytica NRRL Y-17796]|uniref:Vacuolar protein-sorting-associated protein 24 n=1 Tax=Tortispora caseinolytica NRRL Y-17796 TaxID=767744 RepID=A0A1E4TH36_9ASCO|nr:hypothetical protein CANCADRAFT_115722 [Tortispora caseinolytica NRRL Y-17796]